MHPKTNSRRLWLWGLTLAAGLCGSASLAQQPVAGGAAAQPQDKQTGPPPAVKVDPKTGALLVPLGGLVVLDTKLDPPPSRVRVTQETILQANADKDNPAVLRLVGRTPGQTQLTLSRDGKADVVYEVLVQPDLGLLRSIIKRTVPGANVEVSAGLGRVVILTGTVATPQDSNVIERLANSFTGDINSVVNAMQVGGVQQVQIDVVVASVDRNEIRSRGFDFAIRGSNVSITSLVSGLIGVQPLGGVGGVGSAITPSGDANIQVGIVPAQFFGALRALRTEGMAKFLSEPRIVTQSGRPAFFRAGGQQAILGQSSGINGPGVQLVPFGTEVEVAPVVYGNGMIWLEIQPRISSISQGNGIQTVFGFSPGFNEQTARATVLLESGQTYAIGGLIQNSVNASNVKTPILGDLPFVGTGFSRINYEERESELIILVTPRLVAPLDCNQVGKRLPGRESRSPDDYELFLENIFEAPRGQRKVWNGRAYNAPWKCDPTASIYPCVGNVCTGPNGTCLPANGACNSPAGCLPNAVVPGTAANGQHGAGVTTPTMPGYGTVGAGQVVPGVLPGTLPPPVEGQPVGTTPGGN